MVYLSIAMILSGFWIAYEIYRAPLMDDNGRIIKKGKKLSDLFKKKLKK